MSALRVVIAGGGTGGHLYPGIAVARELLSRKPDTIVTFAGTMRGIESRVVPREGFELDVLRSAGLKGKSTTLLLEQNAAPGLTNRMLARVVSAAAVTFESTLPFFGRRGFVAGNPVRPEFVRPIDTEQDNQTSAGPAGRARVLIFC